MRLVGGSSWVRFSSLSVVYVGFAFVAAVPDAATAVRLGAGLVVLWACVQAVSFLCCVRLWRVEDGRVLVPGLRDRRCSIPRSAFAQVNLIDGGVVRVVHGLAAEAAFGRSQLAINMFVSTRDLRRWLDVVGRGE